MSHAPLPNDVKSLRALVIAQRTAVEAAHVTLLSRDVEIEKLKIELARLKRLRYGRSSEQLDRQIAQLELMSWVEREHEWFATPILSERNGLVCPQPIRARSSRAASESTTARHIGISNSSG